MVTKKQKDIALKSDGRFFTWAVEINDYSL